MISSFKGIWIPSELIDLDMSWTKRILIAEISQLEMLEKGCIASNAHFSDKLKISKQGVSKALNELHKDGLIVIDNAQTKRNFGRTITINFSKSAINFSKSAINQSGESKESNSISNKSNIYYDEFTSLWNEYATVNRKKKIVKLSKSRVSKLKCRIEESKNFEDIFKYSLSKASNSTFVKDNSFFTFDWLIMNDSNYLKLSEGNYDDKKTTYTS